MGKGILNVFCVLAILVLSLLNSNLNAQTLPSGVLSVPEDIASIGDSASIGSDTTLYLRAGGVIGKRFDAGNNDGSSTNVEVNISGGAVDDFFTANYGSVINISGGTLGRSVRAGGVPTSSERTVEMNISGGTFGGSFSARPGSFVSVSNGEFDNDFQAFTGSKVTLSGGDFGDDFEAHRGSRVNISGGNFGLGFYAQTDSEVNISGGTFSRKFYASTDSAVNLFGGEFLINGRTPASTQITLSSLDVLSGTLEDGSPFIFSQLGNFSDRLNAVSLVSRPLPTLSTVPIAVSSNNAPAGLRPGQSLMLAEGGVLPRDFSATNAKIMVNGGTADWMEVTGTRLDILGGNVGSFLYASYGSEVNLSGGTIGARFKSQGSIVNISSGSIGDSSDIENGSKLNMSGGSIGERLSVQSGSVVSITGGKIGNKLNVEADTVIEISGGEIGDEFLAGPGSQVSISGGFIGDKSRLITNTQVSGGTFGQQARVRGVLYGDNFLINGEPPTRDSLYTPRYGTLTGTLKDGSPFIFSEYNSDDISSVGFVITPIPPADMTPITISRGVGPNGLRRGQNLTLDSEGILHKNFAAVGATLKIHGGTAERLEVVESKLEIAGGNVALGFSAFGGSEVHVSSGKVGDHSKSYDSEIEISGGFVGDYYVAGSGSNVNISGGVVGGAFLAEIGSSVAISGGTVGDAFSGSRDTVRLSGGTVGRKFQPGSATILGGEFVLNGIPLSDSTITQTHHDILTGTLEDGSPFIFSGAQNSFTSFIDYLYDTNLVNTSVPPVDMSPMIIDGTDAPNGLRAGQTLTVKEGGVLGNNFAAVDATLNVEAGLVERLEVVRSKVTISGGSVGASFHILPESEVTISGGTIGRVFKIFGSVMNIYGGVTEARGEADSASIVNVVGGTLGRQFMAYGSEVNIMGGVVEPYFQADDGSEVYISGGIVEEGFSAHWNTVVNITGGRVVEYFQAKSGSEVNISGGSIGPRFIADRNSTVNISGGHLEDDIFALSGATINISGSHFQLNGVPIHSLAYRQKLVLAERDVILSGLLEDGSPFSYGLYTQENQASSYFASNVTLTVTLVPEPHASLAAFFTLAALSGLRVRADQRKVFGG